LRGANVNSLSQCIVISTSAATYTVQSQCRFGLRRTWRLFHSFGPVAVEHSCVHSCCVCGSTKNDKMAVCDLVEKKFTRP